jgi:hypothetical protein
MAKYFPTETAELKEHHNISYILLRIKEKSILKQHPLSEKYLKFSAFREFALDKSSEECFYTEGCGLTTEQRIN